jgi:hypothetical protein
VNYRYLNAMLAAGMVAASAAPVWAVPTLYPRAGNRLAEVHNTTTSVVLADSSISNQLWVMPPQTGSVGVDGVSLSANAGFCAEMGDLQIASRTISKRIADVFIEFNGLNVELEQLRHEKADLDLQAQALFESTIVQEIDDISDQIFDTEGRIDQLRVDIESCTTPECEDEIRAELDTLQDLKRDLQTQLSALRSDHREDYRAYTRLKNQVDAVQRAIDNVFDQATAKAGFLSTGKNTIFEMYKQYGQLEGGFANVAFDSHWQDNKLQLRTENPGFNVTDIPTSDARAFVALVPGIGQDSYLSQLPAVFGYTLNGQEFDRNNPQQSLAALPDQMLANTRLSLIGACPLAHPDLFDLPTDSTGLPLFGLSATYSYPTAFRTHVRATYNIWKVYEHMKKITEEGGFFSSETNVEETENTDGDSSMTFDFYDESGIPAWQQEQIKQQIKLELMQDVLRLMGVPVPSQGGGVDPLPPPANGAVVLANGIESTCGWWTLYCGGASWILRGLSAIFGSSSSEASFRSSYDFTASREYSTDAVYQRSGMIGFKNESP